MLLLIKSLFSRVDDTINVLNCDICDIEEVHNNTIYMVQPGHVELPNRYKISDRINTAKTIIKQNAEFMTIIYKCEKYDESNEKDIETLRIIHKHMETYITILLDDSINLRHINNLEI
jgi:hypothetical protein